MAHDKFIDNFLNSTIPTATRNEIVHLLKSSIPKPLPVKVSYNAHNKLASNSILNIDMVVGPSPIISEEALRSSQVKYKHTIDNLINRQAERIGLLLKDYNYTQEIDISNLYKKTRIIISNHKGNSVPTQLDLKCTPAISIVTYHYDESLYRTRQRQEDTSYIGKRFLNHIIIGSNNFVWIVSIPNDQNKKEGKFAQIYEFLNTVQSCGIKVFYYGDSTSKSIYFLAKDRPNYYLIPTLTSVEGSVPLEVRDHVTKSHLPDWLSDYELLLCEMWIKLKVDAITNVVCSNLANFRKSNPKPPIQNSFYSGSMDPVDLSPNQIQYLILLTMGVLHLGWNKYDLLPSMDWAL